MALFHFEELREGCPQTQLFRIGGIDPSHQRLGQPFQGLLSQAAPNECGQALILAG